MSEDAIQEDALPQNNARGDAMEQLFAQREAELAGLEPVTEEAEETEEVLEEAEESDDQDDVEEQEDTEESEESENDDPVYKVKIDGEEIEKPLSEILKGYQKDQAASKRLEQAAQERAKLEQERAEFEQLIAERKEQPAQPENQLPDDADEMAKKLYETLTYGDEEEGVNALKALLSGRKYEAIPQEQIVAEAANRALLQMQYSNAERQFLKDNPEIASDATLHSMTMQALSETIPVSQTYEEAFDKAGGAVKSWLSKFSPKPDAVSEKAQRKQSMPKEPVKTGAKAESFPAPKEETASDIIANMRKARGLPV
jgi:hypothetical protein